MLSMDIPTFIHLSVQTDAHIYIWPGAGAQNMDVFLMGSRFKVVYLVILRASTDVVDMAVSGGLLPRICVNWAGLLQL